MSDRRAVSTVVDVSVCLLLVSAAVLALVTAPIPGHSSESRHAARTAATLLTTTSATVTVGEAAGSERSAHGTVAGLLAGAVVANASGDGTFTAPVRAATERTLRGVPGNHRVTARYRSRSGGVVRGRVAVGRPPPRRVDVDAVTFVVPTGTAGQQGRRVGSETGSPDGRVWVTVRTWSE